MTDVTDVPSSRYVIRNLDGLVVALAGFPDDLPIHCNDDLSAVTVGELRKLKELPAPLEIFIPYRLLDDSAVAVNVLGPEWRLGNER